MNKPMRQLFLTTAGLLALFYAAATFLPDVVIDPWHLFHPRKFAIIFLALMSVQSISAIAFQLLGRRLGMVLASALGGLVSSTAVTLTLARASGDHNAHHLAQGITIATVAMLLEAALIVLLASPALFYALLPVWIAVGGTGGALSYIEDKHAQGQGQKNAQVMTISFHWKDALRLTFILSGMLTLIAVAKFTLGDASARMVSFLGALFELHSVIFANVNLPDNAATVGDGARLTIMLCLSAALISKIGLAWFFGVRALALHISGIFGAMIALGWLAYAFF